MVAAVGVPGGREHARGGPRDDDAPDWVVAALEGLDPTARFATFGETWLALGGTPETRASEPHDRPPPVRSAIAR